MEAYKHSCPFCGQHIEYTAGYCGKQMQCPTCGHTVAFPAIPPGGLATGTRRPGLARKAEAKPGLKTSWPGKGMLRYLRGFEHWDTVAQCVVPFLILGALLAGALFVKKNFGNPTAPAPEMVVQAEPGAWKKMTELIKADEAVRVELRAVKAAQASLALAQQIQKGLQTADLPQRRSAEKQVDERQRELTSAQKRFQDAYTSYQGLGGTVDYRRQLFNN